MAPRTRQSAFRGSRRWYRSRLLQALRPAVDVTPDVARELADLLARDGLVRRDGDSVDVA
jgi:hypothetical protein